MTLYPSSAALPAPALPPSLRRVDSGRVAACNALVSLLHGARLRDGKRGIPLRCVRRSWPADPALSVTLDMNGQSVELVFETMPFPDRLQSLTAPWTPESLPDSLRRTVAEVLWEESGFPLPAGSRVEAVSFSPAATDREGIHLALEAMAGPDSVFIHLHAPEGLGAGLNAGRGPAAGWVDRGEILYPPGMLVVLPLVVGRAELNRGEFSDLAEGDVVLVHESNFTPLTPAPAAGE